MSEPCGDIYDPEHRTENDRCVYPAGHDGWHGSRFGLTHWEPTKESE